MKSSAGEPGQSAFLISFLCLSLIIIINITIIIIIIIIINQ